MCDKNDIEIIVILGTVIGSAFECDGHRVTQATGYFHDEKSGIFRMAMGLSRNLLSTRAIKARYAALTGKEEEVYYRIPIRFQAICYHLRGTWSSRPATSICLYVLSDFSVPLLPECKHARSGQLSLLRAYVVVVTMRRVTP